MNVCDLNEPELAIVGSLLVEKMSELAKEVRRPRFCNPAWQERKRAEFNRVEKIYNKLFK